MIKHYPGINALFKVEEAFADFFKGIASGLYHRDTRGAWNGVKQLGKTLKRQGFGVTSTVFKNLDYYILQKFKGGIKKKGKVIQQYLDE